MSVPHGVRTGESALLARQTDLAPFARRPDVKVSECSCFENVAAFYLPHSKGKRMKLIRKQGPKLCSAMLNTYLLQRRRRTVEAGECVSPVGGRRD